MAHYIGIDVSKVSLEIDFCGKTKICKNEPKSIEQLINELVTLQANEQIALIICEATGGYEKEVVQQCHQAKLPIHVAHPNKVRHFAKSKGILAKTDKIDTVILSEYGRLMKPAADVLLLTENTEKIRALLKRRDQLQLDKNREKNRLDKSLGIDIKASIHDHIDWLDQQIKAIDKKLGALEKTTEVSTSYQLLTSIPAIGRVVSHYLLAYLPEIGSLSDKKLAALVGVAPFNHDSGNHKGKRFIQGGRANLRKALFMSAVTAIRCNRDLKTFYLRLRAKGKPARVALTAVMRKLLSMANSVMRRQMPWQENYQPT